MTRLTPTVETSGSVDTDRVPAAGAGPAALVDVVTSNEGVSIIALLTLAHLACVAIGGALGIVSALTGNCHTHICGGGAAIIGVASKARVTLAGVGDAVHTVAVVSTARGAHSRQDGRHAQEVAISDKSLSAEALVGVGVTGSIEATRGGVTSLPALTTDAGQGLGAGVGSGAGLRHAAASGEGVTKCSLATGAGRALRSDDALSIEAADDVITHGGTPALGVLPVADLAATPGSVVLRNTDGVVSTGNNVTRVDAGGGLAGQQAGAVRVTGALHTSGGAHTADQVGVTIGASGALTLVASILIDASKMDKFM